MWLQRILADNKDDETICGNIDGWIDFCKKYKDEAKGNLFKTLFKVGKYKAVDDSQNPVSIIGENKEHSNRQLEAIKNYKALTKHTPDPKLDLSNQNRRTKYKYTDLYRDFTKEYLRDNTTVDLQGNLFSKIPFEFNRLILGQNMDSKVIINLSHNPELNARAELVTTLFLRDLYLRKQEQNLQILIRDCPDEDKKPHIYSMAKFVHKQIPTLETNKAYNKLDKFFEKFHQSENDIKEAQSKTAKLKLTAERDILISDNNKDIIIELIDNVINNEASKGLSYFHRKISELMNGIFYRADGSPETNVIPNLAVAPTKLQQNAVVGIKISNSLIKGVPVVGDFWEIPGILIEETAKQKLDEMQTAKFNLLNEWIRELFDKKDSEIFVKGVADFLTLSLAPILEPLWAILEQDMSNEKSKKKKEFNKYISLLGESLITAIARHNSIQTHRNLIKDIKFEYLTPHKNKMEHIIQFYMHKDFLRIEHELRQNMLEKIFNKKDMPNQIKYYKVDFKPYFVVCEQDEKKEGQLLRIKQGDKNA